MSRPLHGAFGALVARPVRRPGRHLFIISGSLAFAPTPDLVVAAASGAALGPNAGRRHYAFSVGAVRSDIRTGVVCYDIITSALSDRPEVDSVVMRLDGVAVPPLPLDDLAAVIAGQLQPPDPLTLLLDSCATAAAEEVVSFASRLITHYVGLGEEAFATHGTLVRASSAYILAP
jgi:hypothetical protein